MTVVCIAGMHRSGTSMVARLLNLCGFYLGEEKDLLPASDENPEGFWENLAFLEINEEILAHLQAGWDFPVPMQAGWESRPDLQPLRLQAVQLIQQFTPHDRWAWKDPRNSITLPFWLPLIPDLKVVTCLRNPLEVARSLRNRNYFSAPASYHLWLAYNDRLFRSLDPARQIITHVDAYRKDARAELQRVLGLLGVGVPASTMEAATKAVTPPLLHQRAGLEELVAAHPPEGVVELYEQMCTLAGPVFESSLSESWREEPRPPGAHRTYVRNRETAELKATVSEQDQMLQDLTARLTSSEKSVQALTHTLAERERVLDGLGANLASSEKALRDLKAYLDEVQSSKGWRVLAAFWEARVRLIPRGSKRERWLRSLSGGKGGPAVLTAADSAAPIPVQEDRTGDAAAPPPTPEFSRVRPPALFDPDWYLAQHPDARDAEITPYEHYRRFGAAQGYNPNPLFETTLYAKAHGLAAEDALVHFQYSDSLLEIGAYRTADVLVTVQRLNQLGTKTRCVADRRTSARQFAVFLQCGSGSVHEQWLSDEGRPWDLIVNHYDPTYAGRIASDMEFWQEGALPGTKFTAFASLLEARRELTSAYDYWLLLDDDVAMSQADVTRLFSIARDNALDLAQASLSADSYCAHPVFQTSGGGLRSVNAVEIMMPMISQRALRIGEHLFSQTVSGWGLDLVLGDLVHKHLGSRAAVIDEVVARHERPIDVEAGAFYKMLHAAWIFPQIELSHLQRIYGVGRQFFEQPTPGMA